MANLLIIRDLCEKKKITIRELSCRIGKVESTIQTMIRTGSTNTTTLERIAKELDVPVSCFFDDTQGDIITPKGGKGSAMSVHGDAVVGKDKDRYYRLLEKYQDLMEKYTLLLEQKT